jgi:hypothetical protein
MTFIQLSVFNLSETVVHLTSPSHQMIPKLLIHLGLKQTVFSHSYFLQKLETHFQPVSIQDSTMGIQTG